MPLIQSVPDALPYVDTPVHDQQLSAANALINAEMHPDCAATLHPSIPAPQESKLSDFVEAEHARIATGLPKEGGLDISRYELLDPAAKGDLEGWKSTLGKAYASAEYLRGRNINLSLLETYGKNAWLIGNSQMEDVLKGLEKELQEAKLQQEQLEQTRRTIQANAAGEMHGLEEGWRTGIGRMIETQAAGERLRHDILERKRQGAS
ncbi:related to BCAS2 family [Lecanosticta acicola]|uniref:Related to BCAS2 family n=1 Tax=Lecanosticta acicola TaxID=111012 RepID=A0AAI8YWD4_9PEZI|nr:related to BCAS2 family [Lecanosticta acicola]